MPQRITNKISVPNRTPVVSLDLLKTVLRIDINAEDSYLSQLISSAKISIEEYLGISLLNQTYISTLDYPPSWERIRKDGRTITNSVIYNHGSSGSHYVSSGYNTFGSNEVIKIPISPLVSIDSFKIFNRINEESNIGSDSYIVDVDKTPGEIIMNENHLWPELRWLSAIKVVYTAGHGEDVDGVPGDIVQSVLDTCVYRYSNRGETSAQMFPAGLLEWLDRHRVLPT